jgi:hypothetical protein
VAELSLRRDLETKCVQVQEVEILMHQKALCIWRLIGFDTRDASLNWVIYIIFLVINWYLRQDGNVETVICCDS